MRFNGLVIFILLISIPGAMFASNKTLGKPTAAQLPSYPERTRMARVTGTVKLWFSINDDGDVVQADVIAGHPLLRDAALKNLKTWRFGPNVGRAGVKYETEYVYKLDEQKQRGEPKITVSICDSERIDITSELYVKALE